ncbi:MAG: energy transducer TonB [Bacteroidota bacterium]
MSNVKLLRGIGGGCDEVAMEALRKMPKWKPAKQDRNIVRVKFNLPVRFMLEEDSEESKDKDTE